MANGHSNRLPWKVLRGDWRERFWLYVDKGDGCWLWRGPMNGNGRYGMFTYEHQTVVAHRVSYELAFGSFDPSLSVCHECDNPRCVNPEHLFLGTHRENMRDCVDKGRFKRPHGTETHCPKGHPYSGYNLIVYRGKRGEQRMCRQCGLDRAKAKRAAACESAS
jgi:hypothetical protein